MYYSVFSHSFSVACYLLINFLASSFYFVAQTSISLDFSVYVLGDTFFNLY